MHLAIVLLVAMVTSQVAGHGMPIWEMLPRQEKMGQIMYLLMDTVDHTCSFAYIPDCHHVLALHGITNLINLDEYTLNSLDPHQTGARQVIWAQVMRGGYDLPPAYLPSYYLGIEVDEMTNEIDSGYPTHPRHPQHDPSSSAFLYPYVPIPSSHNKPEVAVNNPHPYAVKVAPPPEFTRTNTHTNPSHESEGKESEVRMGNQQTEGGVLLGWSNGDATGDKQRAGDRFASWFDEGATENGALPTENRFVTPLEEGTTGNGQRQGTEDIRTSWSNGDSESVEGGNRFTEAQKNRDQDAEEESTELTDRQQEAETDRYASWVDSEAGMEEYNTGTINGPAGITPTGNYEPIMVESSVVVSRVPPPMSRVSPLSQLAPSSSSSSSSSASSPSSFVQVEEGKKRSAGSRPSLLLLPLPLLRQ